jgi:predicted SAM-dependent methyltransferase
MSDYSELLLGAGSRHVKAMTHPFHPEWEGKVTLDMEPRHKPDVLWDLRSPVPLPFADNLFDEVHAYEVLEHIGQQGDHETFFRQFADYWRVLKPNGYFFASVPGRNSPWLWGDPGHTRHICKETLVFLEQPQYEQVGKTAMSDYRGIYKADFDVIDTKRDEDSFYFALKAVKPSRYKETR